MATVTGNVPEIAMKAMNVQKAISKAKVTVAAAWKIMENYGGRSSYCPNDSGNENLNTERLYIHDHRNKYREDEY